MDIVTRMKIFLDSHEITSSQFADNCSIPRPTMSQILNGRNKKISDELISKIHNAYPELSVLWLMFGEGDMEVNSNTQISASENSEFSHPYSTLPTDNQDSDNFSFDENSDQVFTSNNAEQDSKSVINHSNNISNDKISIQNTDIDSSFNFMDDNENIALKSSEAAVIDFESPLQNIPLPSINDTNLSSKQNFDSNFYPKESLNQSSRDEIDKFNTETTRQINRKPLSDKIETPTEKSCNFSIPMSNKEITNIVVFYSDNSFQTFHPSKFGK